jgi:hypothetical protein
VYETADDAIGYGADRGDVVSDVDGGRDLGAGHHWLHSRPGDGSDRRAGAGRRRELPKSRDPRMAGPPGSGVADDRPHLARRDEAQVPPDPAPAQVKPKLESVEGTLRQVDCNGTTARLTLESGGKLFRFVIKDPNHIAIRNAGAGPVDFQCGPQKPRAVLLEYEAKVDAPEGIAGELRSIEFR